MVEINTGIKKEKKEVRCWEIRNSWGNSGDNGYCKIACSVDVEANKIIELDIPKILLPKTPEVNMVCRGGVITFLPGDLPKSVDEILNIKRTIQLTEPPIETVSKNNNWIKICIGIGLIIVFVVCL